MKPTRPRGRPRKTEADQRQTLVARVKPSTIDRLRAIGGPRGVGRTIDAAVAQYHP